MPSILRIFLALGLVLFFAAVGWIAGLILWAANGGLNPGAGVAPLIYSLPALVGAALGLFLATKLPGNRRK